MQRILKERLDTKPRRGLAILLTIAMLFLVVSGILPIIPPAPTYAAETATVTITQAMTVEEVRSAINIALKEVGKGGTVTVTGSKTDASEILLFDKGNYSDQTIVWEAIWTSSHAIHINFDWRKTFEVAAGAAIKCTGSGSAIYIRSSDTTVKVTGGTVESEGYTAISTGMGAEKVEIIVSGGKVITNSVDPLYGGSLAYPIQMQEHSCTSVYLDGTLVANAGTVLDGRGISVKVDTLTPPPSYIGTDQGLTVKNGTAYWKKLGGKPTIIVKPLFSTVYALKELGSSVSSGATATVNITQSMTVKEIEKAINNALDEVGIGGTVTVTGSKTDATESLQIVLSRYESPQSVVWKAEWTSSRTIDILGGGKGSIFEVAEGAAIRCTYFLLPAISINSWDINKDGTTIKVTGGTVVSTLNSAIGIDPTVKNAKVFVTGGTVKSESDKVAIYLYSESDLCIYKAGTLSRLYGGIEVSNLGTTVKVDTLTPPSSYADTDQGLTVRDGTAEWTWMGYGSINGIRVTPDLERNKVPWGSFAPISEVEAVVTDPVAGQTPKYTAISGDIEGYTAEVRHWYDGMATPENIMSPTDTFAAGKVYVAEVVFAPQPGQFIIAYPDMAVNGMKGARLPNEGLSSITRVVFKTEAIPIINGATVTVTEPVSGALPDYTAVSGDSSLYTTEVRYWYEYFNLPSGIMDSSDEFYGGTYFAEVVLSPVGSAKFATAPVVYINGIKGTRLDNEGDNMVYRVMFDLPYPAREITNLNLRVTAPVAGKTPENSVGTGSEYSAAVTNWYSGGTVSSPGTAMSATDTFAAAGTYIVEIKADINDTDNFFFADSVNAAVNYNYEDAYHVSGNSTTVTYRMAFEGVFQTVTPLSQSGNLYEGKAAVTRYGLQTTGIADGFYAPVVTGLPSGVTVLEDVEVAPFDFFGISTIEGFGVLRLWYDGTTPEGVYPITVKIEGADPVAMDLTILAPYDSGGRAVLVGEQTGTVYAGTGGTVTYDVEVPNIGYMENPSAAPIINWYSDSLGITPITPDGISGTKSALVDDGFPNSKATVTIDVDSSAAAKTYYFRVSYGSPVEYSEMIPLTVLWDDTMSLSVISVSPSGTGADVNGFVFIQFSKAMDTATTGTVQLNGSALSGGEWSEDETEYSIPYSGLSYGTAYTVSISGFKDASVAGIFMTPDDSNSFTTANAPLPTGNINIGTDNWKTLLHTITFALFSKSIQTVEITATDNGGGTVTIQYLLATVEMTETELDTAIWTTYSAPFNINPNNKQIVYAKLTDPSGNKVYISSNGIVVYTDSAQDTANISFTKGSTADVTANVTLNGNTINTIKNGAATLTEGTHYTVSGETITFTASYLNSLTTGNYTLTVSYNPLGETFVGGDAPATTTIGLTVISTGVSTYTVTYNGNGNTGGTAPVDSNSPYSAGSTVIVMDQGSLLKTSYTFLGWSTNPNAVAPHYTTGYSFYINSSITLYAVWEENIVAPATYSVTYQPGTHGTFTPQVTSGLSIGDATPQAPTVTGEDGWVFAGWSPVPTATVTGNASYVAQWNATYSVTYQPGTHGTFTPQVTSGLGIGDATPQAPAVTGEDGWAFTGWSPVPTATVTGNATYVAQWNIVTPPPLDMYTVTFVDWDGRVLKTEQVAHGNSATAPTNPLRSGYTFIGWDKSSDNITSDLTVTALYNENATPPPPAEEEDTWALFNLILATAGVLTAIAVLVYMLMRRKLNLMLLAVMALGIVGLIVFLLTQSMGSGKMVVADMGTILSAIILTAEVIVVVLVLKLKKGMR